MNPQILTFRVKPVPFEIPADISESEVIRYFTLTDTDKVEALKCRGVHNQLGFALQLCALRMLGAFPTDIVQVPAIVLNYLAKQMSVSTPLILDYPLREQTRWDHAERIRRYLGYRTFGENEKRKLRRFLLEKAMQTDRPSLLFDAACHFLLQEKIERAGPSTIEKIVGAARATAERRVLSIISRQLKAHHRHALDGLLEKKEDQSYTLFHSFKMAHPKASAANLLVLTEKIALIESLGVEAMDLSRISKNRRQWLAALGMRYDASTMGKLGPDKRYAILVCFLQNVLAELRDTTVEMFDDLITRVFRRSERDQDEATVQAAPALEDTAGHSHLLKRYNPTQQFFPPLLETLRFKSRQPDEPLLETLDRIQQGALKHKRDLPDEMPTDFLAPRLAQALPKHQRTDRRHLYELGTMEALKNALRAGDVFIEGGHRYADFYEHLLPDTLWQARKSQYYRQLDLPEKAPAHLDTLAKDLDERMAHVESRLPKNEAVSIQNGRFSVSNLTAEEVSESVLRLRDLIKRRMPKIKLPDLLMQVDAWTPFSQHFSHLTDRAAVTPNLQTPLFANFIAQGCNLGPSKMAEASPGLTYAQLAWVGDWFIREETLRQALAALVNFHRHLPLARVWGEGLYSASDAQRFGLRGSSLMGDRYLPEFGFRRRGVGFYTFVSDQYAPFYVDVTSLGVRESVYALDGLLGHESELSPIEHYVDTAGYTENVFAMFHLMGIRFAPRLKDLPHQQLYRFHKEKTFEHLDTVLTKTIHTDLIAEQWDEIVRLAASVKNLMVAPSLLLRRMGSYSRKSRLVRAFQELGRIHKTLYLLDYIDNPDLRRRVLVGINKLDTVHKAARYIFYGRQGELRVPGYQEQLHRASCLVLILMALLVWNTVQITQIVETLRAEGHSVIEDDLRHVSPLMYEHVLPYGEYHFDRDRARREAGQIKVVRI